LGGNKFQLGVIEGAADSASSLVKLWSGGRSDRGGGRKPLVVVGYALAAIVRPLCAVIALPWQLFGVRIADRIGKGIRTSPRDALIADSTEPEIRGRAFGFHRGMDHLGAAVGPLLAAAFLWFWPNALRKMFLLTLAPGAMVVLLLIFGLRERKRTAAPQDGAAKMSADDKKESGAWSLRSFDRRFRLYLFALVIFTLGNSSDAFLLVRAGELGVQTWLLPILWCVFHVVKSAGNMFGGRMVDRFGPRPMILLGWIYYAAIYLAFAMAAAAWHVWALFIAYAIFYAVTEPAEKTLVANLVGQSRRGLAYGWYNCAVGIATLPASLAFGAIYQAFGPLAAFGSGAALALAAAILLARL
jgi:MFS family permease